ncbi:hypothetical protein FKP32DRAFT_1574242 [Trametes sanguinea]|nr:hypothetical protein FKP32DRAFT_1574242 [Trametes sanguinea]
MVAPMFILTRTFAISAMFVGAFPVTYAAPVPTVVVKSISPRWCRQVGCLYAIPESTTSGTSSTNTSLVPSSSSASSSALQVIDILISALQSAASTLREQSSSSLPSPANDAADLPESMEDDTLAAVISTDESISTPEDTSMVASEDPSSPPAVEVVGYSTVDSAEVRVLRFLMAM